MTGRFRVDTTGQTLSDTPQKALYINMKLMFKLFTSPECWVLGQRGWTNHGNVPFYIQKKTTFQTSKNLNVNSLYV